ncbi:MAG: GNAT family N-acetyltransferase [bacterium]
MSKRVNNIEYSFKYSLTGQEKDEIIGFYTSLDEVSLEQYPDWYQVYGTEKKVCFFLAKRENRVVCFTHIYENLFKTAHIHFGPIFHDPNILIDSVRQIYRHYKARGFTHLSIQLGIKTNSTSEYIEYVLNRDLKIKTFYDRHNWSSVVVDLSRDLEEIYKNFSSNHKRSIKKALKLGVQVREIKDLSTVEELCAKYIKMYKHRKTYLDEARTQTTFARMYDFFQEHKAGLFLGAWDRDEHLVGGLVLLLQGHSFFYSKGVADPDYRHMPVTHLAFFEAMKMAKAAGFRYFDFGGYNHFVDANDQVYEINRFKAGFSRNFVFYPKIMHFDYRPLPYKLVKLARSARDFQRNCVAHNGLRAFSLRRLWPQFN